MNKLSYKCAYIQVPIVKHMNNLYYLSLLTNGMSQLFIKL